jgi:hypothetical protein
MATVKKIKKAQLGSNVKSTADSTSFYKKQGNIAAQEMSNAKTPVQASLASNRIATADKNVKRQSFKGKPGYDNNGFPQKKKGGIIKKSKCGTKMSKKK